MAQRVLLVEDHDENRGIFATILRHSGLDVVEARTGTRALELARERAPDIVLLDVGLPDLSGFEVMERMADDPELGDLPVVVVTAHVAQEVEERARTLGARRYLTKPIPPRELAQAVLEELAALRDYEAAS